MSIFVHRAKSRGLEIQAETEKVLYLFQQGSTEPVFGFPHAVSLTEQINLYE